MRINQIVIGVILHSLHEHISDSHRNVEVVQRAGIILAIDEIQNIRMINTKNTHVGSTSGVRYEEALTDVVANEVVMIAGNFHIPHITSGMLFYSSNHRGIRRFVVRIHGDNGITNFQLTNLLEPNVGTLIITDHNGMIRSTNYSTSILRADRPNLNISFGQPGICTRNIFAFTSLDVDRQNLVILLKFCDFNRTLLGQYQSLCNKTTTLLNAFSGSIKGFHERNRTRSYTTGRSNGGTSRTQSGERESSTTTALMNQSSVPNGIEDPLHRILNRKNKTCRKLTQRATGIHDRGTVGEEIQVGHHVVKFILIIRNMIFNIFLGCAIYCLIRNFCLSNSTCNAMPHLIGSLDDVSIFILFQISGLQNFQRIFRQLLSHV